MLQLLELIERPLRGLKVCLALAVMDCFDVLSVISCFRVLSSRYKSAFDTCYPPFSQTFN